MIDTGRLGFRRVVLLTACCAALGGGVSVAQASRSEPGGALPANPGSRAGMLPWCADSSSVTAILLHRKLVWLLTTDDADMADHRAGMASQPRLEPAEVSWVHDEALCAAASRMLDSALFTSPKAAPVYLHRIGGRYAAASTQGPYLALTDSALAPLLLTEF